MLGGRAPPHEAAPRSTTTRNARLRTFITEAERHMPIIRDAMGLVALESRVGEEREDQFLEALGLAHVHDVVRALDDHLP